MGNSRYYNRVKIRSRTHPDWELEGNMIWQTDHKFAIETGFNTVDDQGNDIIRYEVLELSFDKWTVIYHF